MMSVCRYSMSYRYSCRYETISMQAHTLCMTGPAPVQRACPLELAPATPGMRFSWTPPPSRTDRQIDRQAGRQTERQADRQTDTCHCTHLSRQGLGMRFSRYSSISSLVCDSGIWSVRASIGWLAAGRPAHGHETDRKGRGERERTWWRTYAWSSFIDN